MDFVRTKRLRMVEPAKLQQLNPFRAKCISMLSKLELATAKHTFSSEETSKDMHGSVQIDIDHLGPRGYWLSYFTHHNEKYPCKRNLSRHLSLISEQHYYTIIWVMGFQLKHTFHHHFQ